MKRVGFNKVLKPVSEFDFKCALIPFLIVGMFFLCSFQKVIADSSEVRGLDNLNSTINGLYSGLQGRYPELFKLNSENFELSQDRCLVQDPLPFWCHQYAQFYWHGKVVKQDYVKAYKYFEIAANLGYANSQSTLGNLHFAGKGSVEKNLKKAVAWWSKAADQNHSRAQFKLAVMYERGTGVKRDYNKSFNLYLKAASQGNTKAQVNLCAAYIRGLGVKKDYGEALFWCQKAAKKGNAQAMSSLAFMYGNGLGVARDIDISISWLEKAAKEGHAESKAFLREMGR